MKFSIRRILLVTMIVAVYFGIHRFAPVFALHCCLGPCVLFVAMAFSGRQSWIVALPSFAAASFFLGNAVLSLPRLTNLATILWLVWWAVIGLIDIAIYAVQRTRAKYKDATDRQFLILESAIYCVAGGFFTGLKVGVSLLTLSLLLIVISPHFIAFGLVSMLYFPIGFALLGLAAAIPIGFICDALVSRDFGQRFQRERAEAIANRLSES